MTVMLSFRGGRRMLLRRFKVGREASQTPEQSTVGIADNCTCKKKKPYIVSFRQNFYLVLYNFKSWKAFDTHSKTFFWNISMQNRSSAQMKLRNSRKRRLVLCDDVWRRCQVFSFGCVCVWVAGLLGLGSSEMERGESCERDSWVTWHPWGAEKVSISKGNSSIMIPFIFNSLAVEKICRWQAWNRNIREWSVEASNAHEISTKSAFVVFVISD